MKIKNKNKGKVYPSPSSSSSASHSSDEHVLSVLKLLPAAILALASVLSIEDREVLVYMITRSMETTLTSSIIQGTMKKSSNSKKTKTIHNKNNTHKPPVFDCDCFDCYTSYWFRWDSSPNRELIHQVIEAFEDHLTNGEKSKKNAARAKKKERMTRRITDASPQNKITSPEIPAPDMDDNCGVAEPQDDEASPSISPRAGEDDATAMNVEPQPVNTQLPEEELKLVFRGSAASNNRGLARKVLPDVLGLLNSRLWSFWSPNV